MFKLQKNGTIIYDGLEYRLLEALAQTLNFSFEINTPADGEKWGREFKNGSWTGNKI